MQSTVLRWPRREENRSLAPAELAQLCGISSADIQQLVANGALAPLSAGPGRDPAFSVSQVPLLREAAQLRQDYGLDLATTGMLLGYLRRIAQLERELRGLRGHLGPAPLLPREGPASWREPHA
jgi:hypothetical protein